jgi:hypothetical protein
MGCGGYLAKCVSVCDFWQSRNCEPRPLTIVRIQQHDWQSDFSKLGIDAMGP